MIAFSCFSAILILTYLPTQEATTASPTRSPTRAPTSPQDYPTAYHSSSNEISGWYTINQFTSSDCSGNAFYVEGYQTGYCYPGSTNTSSTMYRCIGNQIYTYNYYTSDACVGAMSTGQSTIGYQFNSFMTNYCEQYQCIPWAAYSNATAGTYVGSTKLPIPATDGKSSYGVNQ
jgi:hypothetical protein